LDPFGILQFRAAEGWAVGVRQHKSHRLDIAGVTQFAEFLCKPLAVDRLAKDCAQFLSSPRSAARITAAALLPGSFRYRHF
jgi:hypothetical protein